MNILPFSSSVKRIPIWGLGCAGGASGLARAFEYCKAFPKANVLVLAVELCSLTFQLDDRSKSNLIGTSLFGDGAACMLVCGMESPVVKAKKTLPHIFAYQKCAKKDALDVMGWDIRNNGLYVIFSKDIPTLVANWLKPVVEDFWLSKNFLGTKYPILSPILEGKRSFKPMKKLLAFIAK